MAISSAPDSSRPALLAGIAAYLTWGVIPLAFQQMGRLGADAWEIMAHRAVWGMVFAGLLVLAAGQRKDVAGALRQPAVIGWLLLSTLLIVWNWTTYVIAVNGGHALEASLGYYLNPLLNMAAGAWLFRERISRPAMIAIALAGIGVVIQAVALGRLPWVSLVLAFTFCAYGVIRKRIAVEAQSGLFIECLFMLLPGIAWIWHLQSTGAGHLFASTGATFWLVMGGPLTVVPLALFAWAARRLTLSTLGFIQFIAPTLVFAIGVLQGEAFGWLRAISFLFIWAGVATFLVGAVLSRRQSSDMCPEPV